MDSFEDLRYSLKYLKIDKYFESIFDFIIFVIFMYGKQVGNEKRRKRFEEEKLVITNILCCSEMNDKQQRLKQRKRCIHKSIEKQFIPSENPFDKEFWLVGV